MKQASLIGAALFGACLAPTYGVADPQIDALSLLIRDCRTLATLEADGANTPQQWTLLTPRSAKALQQEFSALSVLRQSLRDSNESGPFRDSPEILSEFVKNFTRMINDPYPYPHLDLTHKKTRVLVHDTGWTLVAQMDDWEAERCAAWHREPTAKVIDFLTQDYLGQQVAMETPLGKMSYLEFKLDGTFRGEERKVLVNVTDSGALLEALEQDERAKHPIRFLPQAIVDVF